MNNYYHVFKAASRIWPVGCTLPTPGINVELFITDISAFLPTSMLSMLADIMNINLTIIFNGRMIGVVKMVRL
jgi:hypothetical protein